MINNILKNNKNLFYKKVYSLMISLIHMINLNKKNFLIEYNLEIN